jgi:hypothetical protein
MKAHRFDLQLQNPLTCAIEEGGHFTITWTGRVERVLGTGRIELRAGVPTVVDAASSDAATTAPIIAQIEEHLRNCHGC